MAKIFISYAREDSALAQRTYGDLAKRKHDVFLDQQSLRPGSHWLEDIKSNLQDADVFLALVTAHSDQSYYFNIEVTAAIAYVTHGNDDKLILPVVVGKETIENKELGAFHAIFGSADEYDLVLDEIDKAISSFEGYRLARQELERLRTAALEQKSADYVKETMDELQLREKAMTRLANRWHLLGYSSFILCIIAVLVTWWVAERAGYSSTDVIKLIVVAVKGAVVLALVLGLAKYSFLLARTYQTEALKTADRIHAISFGKFYMRIFGDRVTQADLRDVFQHWNTAGVANLAHQDVDKIDARLFELLSQLATQIKKEKDNKP